MGRPLQSRGLTGSDGAVADFRTFPEDFLWGAATSAYQVEGGITNNDWYRFEMAGKVVDGEVCGACDDSYHRYEEDLDLARALDNNAHRLSLEWSRIEPSEGEFDEAEIAHYRDVLQAVRDRGMKVFLTINHWTLPLWIADRGSWDDAGIVDAFVAFATKCGEAFGDLVDTWITVNEPIHLINLGYYVGRWPPEQASFFVAYNAGQRMIQAHNRTYDALKRITPDTPVGVAVNSIHFKPCKNTTVRDRLYQPFFDWFVNFYFLDKVRDHIDFIGVQYYMAMSAAQFMKGVYACHHEGVHTDMGWRICPQGIRQVVRDTYRRYRKPIYVTENGIADAADRLRPAYLRSHLVELHKAMTEDGADVRGYFHWSLLDNFEWSDGWAPKFGLYAVDRETFKRTARPSAAVYARICADNGLPDMRISDEIGEVGCG